MKPRSYTFIIQHSFFNDFFQTPAPSHICFQDPNLSIGLLLTTLAHRSVPLALAGMENNKGSHITTTLASPR